MEFVDWDAQRTASRWFTALLVLYIAFIATASLILGTGEVSLDKGLARLGDLRREVATVHDLRDIATNVLLYIPLGALAALRIDPARLRVLSPWLALGPVVSLVMEIAQSFTDRTPDLVDLFTNTSGHVAGFLLVVIAVQRIGLKPAALLGLSSGQQSSDQLRTVQGLLFLYVCVYAILQLAPFDISVRLENIHGKLLGGESGVPRIILDPLFHVRQGAAGVLPMLYALIGVAPIAALRCHIRASQAREAVLSPLWFVTAVAAALELGQVFVLSRTTDIVDILLAPLGGLLGVALARGWHRLQHTATPRHEADRPTHIVGFALVIYLVILTVLTWAPYQFELDVPAILRKLKTESNWWPFREHFALRNLPAARDLVEETVQTIPLGLLLIVLVQRLRPGLSFVARLAVVAALCAGVGGFLELTQVACKGRFVDITDVVLAITGGVIGGLLSRVLARRT